MKPSDELYLLIHSLSPSEKRYFKLFANRHIIGKKNSYVKVFDILDKQKEFDEALTIKMILQQKITDNYPSVKNYLYSLILRSMRQFYESRTVSQQLNNMLIDIQFLFEKGFFKKAEKVLKQAMKLANKSQSVVHSLQLSTLERRMVKNVKHRNASKRLDTISKNEKEIIKSIGQYIELREWYDKLYIHTIKNYQLKNPDKQKDEFLKKLEEFLKQPINPTSFDAKICYYLINADFYQLLGNMEKTQEYQKKMVDLYHSEQVLIDLNQERYLSTVNNYCNSLFLSGNYSELPALFDALKKIKIKSFNSEAFYLRKTTFYELIYYLNTNQLEKAEAIADTVEKKQELLAKLIPQQRMMTFIYNIGVLYFLMENFTKALDWFNKIIFDYPNDIRRDLHRASRILHMIIHFELENFDFLDSAIRSNKRFYKQNKTYTKLERIAPILLNRITLTIPSDRKKIYDRAMEETENWEQDYKRNIGVDEFLIWLEARKRGIGLRDVLQARQPGSS